MFAHGDCVPATVAEPGLCDGRVFQKKKIVGTDLYENLNIARETLEGTCAVYISGQGCHNRKLF